MEIIASAIAGGIGGLLLLAAFDPHGQADMDGLAVLVGMVIAVGINRLLRS